jgi:hypothetical protein
MPPLIIALLTVVACKPDSAPAPGGSATARVGDRRSAIVRTRMARSSSDDVIVGDTTTFTAQVTARYLDAHPAVVAALRTARARVAPFEVPEVYGHEQRFFTYVQQALDRAEAAIGAHDRPVYVAFTNLPTIAETGAFSFRRTAEPSAFVPMHSRRGPFLGYVALAEGGLAFFDDKGQMRGQSPREQDVLEALRWPWP